MAVSSRLKLPVLLLRYRVTTCFLINSRFDRKKIQLCIFYFLLFIYQNGFPHIFPLQVILSLSSKSLVFFGVEFQYENTTGINVSPLPSLGLYINIFQYVEFLFCDLVTVLILYDYNLFL
jgi:hypothetical protein